MQRAPRPSRAQTIAMPRPQSDVTSEWVVAAVALALLLAALLV